MKFDRNKWAMGRGACPTCKSDKINSPTCSNPWHRIQKVALAIRLADKERELTPEQLNRRIGATT